MTTSIMTSAWSIWDFVKSLKARKHNPFSNKFDKECYNELSRMTDYELKDIGICRGDIYEVCQGKNIRRNSL